MDEGRRRQFELLVQRFLEQTRVLGWSPRTITAYASHLRFLLDYLAEETEVEDVTGLSPEVLHSYQTWLYSFGDENGRGLAIATQAARLSAVRSFFRYLVKSDVLLYDPPRPPGAAKAEGHVAAIGAQQVGNGTALGGS